MNDISPRSSSDPRKGVIREGLRGVLDGGRWRAKLGAVACCMKGVLYGSWNALSMSVGDGRWTSAGDGAMGMVSVDMLGTGRSACVQEAGRLVDKRRESIVKHGQT